jgi:hypothetical protein
METLMFIIFEPYHAVKLPDRGALRLAILHDNAIRILWSEVSILIYGTIPIHKPNRSDAAMLMLDFEISGEDYHKVIAWRTEGEMKIIRHALATRGQLMVILHTFDRSVGRMRRITEVPEPGSCEPYVSEVGGANSYCFLPLAEGGYRLRVYRNSNGVATGYTDTIEPLCLQSSATCVRWNVAEMGGRTHEKFISSHIDSEEECSNTLRFRIATDEMDRFLEFAQDRLELSLYEFRFIPLSVGTMVFVTRCSDGVENHLTEDWEW